MYTNYPGAPGFAVGEERFDEIGKPKIVHGDLQNPLSNENESSMQIPGSYHSYNEGDLSFAKIEGLQDQNIQRRNGGANMAFNSYNCNSNE